MATQGAGQAGQVRSPLAGLENAGPPGDVRLRGTPRRPPSAPARRGGVSAREDAPRGLGFRPWDAAAVEIFYPDPLPAVAEGSSYLPLPRVFTFMSEGEVLKDTGGHGRCPHQLERSVAPASKRSHVHRRGILELAGTLNCVGTRTPMAYMNYGCYCGLGGHGQPRDAIDWCCYHHDCCYTRAEEAGCSPKMERYSWECVNQHILCGPAEDECQKLLCKCDEEIAYCLAKTEYNLKYLFYPQFLCEQDSPKCD